MSGCYQPLNPHLSYSPHSLNVKLVIVHRWRGVSCQLGGKRNGMIIRKRKVQASLEIDMRAWRWEKTVYMRVNWHGPALKAIYCNWEGSKVERDHYDVILYWMFDCWDLRRSALNCSSMRGRRGRDAGCSWFIRRLQFKRDSHIRRSQTAKGQQMYLIFIFTAWFEVLCTSAFAGNNSTESTVTILLYIWNKLVKRVCSLI